MFRSTLTIEEFDKTADEKQDMSDLAVSYLCSFALIGLLAWMAHRNRVQGWRRPPRATPAELVGLGELLGPRHRPDLPSVAPTAPFLPQLLRLNAALDKSVAPEPAAAPARHP